MTKLEDKLIYSSTLPHFVEEYHLDSLYDDLATGTFIGSRYKHIDENETHQLFSKFRKDKYT